MGHQMTAEVPTAAPRPANRGPAVAIEALSYTPEGAESPILDEIDLRIEPGEFVIVCGPSGSGKSTLLSCINGVIPHFATGQLDGRVLVGGIDTSDSEMAEISTRVATVFQDPSVGVFSLTVENEVAFGPENLGRSKADLDTIVPGSLEAVGITHLANAPTASLSGGQLQRTALAGAIAMGTELIVLDEPTTDLDPVGKEEVSRQVAALKDLGERAIVVVEHDLDHLVEYADRIIVLAAGRVVFDMAPRELFTQHTRELSQLGVRLPDHVRLSQMLLDKGYEVGPPDGTIERARTQLQHSEFRLSERETARLDTVEEPHVPPVLKFTGVTARYGRRQPPKLVDVNLEVSAGEIVAILGKNGAGKSTLVKTACRLVPFVTGSVEIDGQPVTEMPRKTLADKLGFCFQNPDHQLFCNTVEAELAFGLHPESSETDKRVQNALHAVGLDHANERHPHELSRGQRKRLAVATALIRNPSIVFLDEPTTGQDAHNVRSLFGMVKKLAAQDRTAILMITHDLELALAEATRILVVNGGRVEFDGPTRLFEDYLTDTTVPGVHWSIASNLLQECALTARVKYLRDFNRRLLPVDGPTKENPS